MQSPNRQRPRLTSYGATRRPTSPKLLPGGVDPEAAEEENPAKWWRLFVAVELPKPTIDTLAEMAASMRAWSHVGQPRRRPTRGAAAFDAVRWTDPKNLHITVKFLGDVHQDDVTYLKEELDGVAAAAATLRLRIADNGCFPGERTPRVLWTGLDGDLRRMAALASRLEGAMVRCGLPEDRRTFTPHVTVGRVRTGTQKRILAAIGQRWLDASADSDATRRPSIGREVPVNAIALIRSHLHHNRPTRYERLHLSGLS